MRQKIVAGNWKMNCDRDEALGLATEIAGMVRGEVRNGVTVVLAPPFVHLGAVHSVVSGTGIVVAAQNCSSESKGAYTGEVSASMIRSVGCGYVIIGHSERRQYYHETGDLLARKTDQALQHHLVPIFCVGETLPQREAGGQEKVVEQQLTEGLGHLDAERFKKVVIAYEPVWAIGTGKTASAAQAQEMHAFIRGFIAGKHSREVADRVSILYGGSCNENNAKELFALPDVDGGLIGGASLKSRGFVTVIKSF